MQGMRQSWQNHLGQTKTILYEKAREALASVLPLQPLCWYCASRFTDTARHVIDVSSGSCPADLWYGPFHSRGRDSYDSHW